MFFLGKKDLQLDKKDLQLDKQHMFLNDGYNQL